MALSDKKYERMFSTTGSDADKIETKNFNEIKADFDDNSYIDNVGQFKILGPVIYQIQLLTEELDALRTEISANKDKVSMTLGTSGSTALAGDTTTITTDQANAITANTAKTSMTLGTTSKTALAGDTTTISTSQANEITASTKLGLRLQASRQASLTKSTTIEFGEFTTKGSGKTLTYSLPITVVETDTSGKSPVITTKRGSITLT